ncbi:MAG: macrolide ABC transporter ATP-binding protein [Candidatus Kerfeldbacteria bacterium RIFCSPHIGHO2_12_FULL_48_17]|uniref:Macrolide ABC transporter ATP-binding protein n=1 Tax=Candidatus Kerfeldbacteria bacterium RIFCSPHIGHO2_12_FULL_48_17 TaxID=1798542 RepID=A0A1G2B185_9BACT|nr:MAG: macrolide ABC transporter ATP-binding protein [Candidatus Kerfeldbacteria bacterium RIFCSPHIGHO2_12_FULL_48_17]
MVASPSSYIKKSTVAQSLIVVRQLKKTYWLGEVAVPALRGINLEIKKGEFVAFMGPSGSGKSTLMNLLAFLDVPTSGTYRFANVNTSDFNDNALAELRNKRIGFIFQQFYLLARTTALENVRLPLMYQHMKKSEQLERAETALHKVGLGSHMQHESNKLSGGQQQRVAIARAIVNNPDILFGDEPTGNLDSKTAKDIMKILQKLNQEGRTIVLVTHDTKVATYAQRIIHLQDGLIV